jgi:hypothetical protein
MRIELAFRAFWAVLFQPGVAERVRAALAPGAAEPAPVPPAPKPVAGIKPSSRNDAITLLSTLQREARFLDLVQEPLGDYSDAQIGAAARDVLRGCASVLERMFGLKPATTQAEGSDVEVPKGYDPLQYRVVGNVSGEPPLRGKLTHHGWTASRCELPAWVGSAPAANVIAPIEIEVG